jgi:hypothetical protein
MTPSVSARWMHGKLLVAQSIAAINLQILSFDETEYAKLVEKTNIGDAAVFGAGVIMPRR